MKHNIRLSITIFMSMMLIVLLAPKTAYGVTVLGNYPPANNNLVDIFINIAKEKAFLFQVPAANAYMLNSYTVRLGSVTESTYRVDLYMTDGVNRGALVGTLGTQNVNTASYNVYADVTFTPSSPILLVAGQSYWLQIGVTSLGTGVTWAGAYPGVAPSGVFTSLGFRVTHDSSMNWTTSTDINSLSIDADVLVVPTSTPTDTATNTPIPPTNTPTNTPVPATGTATNTPTDTPTSTPLPPTNTPTSTPVTPTPTPTLPLCIFGLPPGGVQGRVLIDVLAFYNPSLEATTNILVQGGSSWWITDARNGFYKLWISCEGEPIWVLANTIAPNFDNVWNGASLPDAGE